MNADPVLVADVDIEADADEFAEKVIPQDPLMELLQLRHEYVSTIPCHANKDEIQGKIMTIVRANNMVPYYKELCTVFGWTHDEDLANTMAHVNTERLASLDAKIRDAEENLGDSDVRDSLLEKAEFYGSIGDRDRCIQFNEECGGRTLGVGPRLDLAFQRIRVGFAFRDRDLIIKSIAAAHDLLKNHGDWERRNRLKVYEGIYYAMVRNFSKAAELLIDSVATFSSTEFVSYRTFISITASIALVVLDRLTLKKKIVDNSDVGAVMPEIPHVRDLIHAVYHCQYRKVYTELIGVCDMFLSSVFLKDHANYYFREVRVLAFQQFLESYRSVTLQSMSHAFRISEELLDAQLCAFASAGRLSCRMDRVSGNVYAEKPDKVNYFYSKIIKQGDIVLNQVQKLCRVAST